MSAGKILGASMITLLVACAPTARPVSVERTRLSLSSAIIAPSEVVSCRGVAFCREDTIAPGHDDVREDVVEDCARHKGTISATPCSISGVIATCTVTSGEAGNIRVVGYRQDDPGRETETLDTMAKACEQFDGTYVTTSR